MLLDHWSKIETAIVLFADKGLRRIGNVRIVSVSYEQQSVTVEMDDGNDAEFYLVDTEMCQGVNSETLIEECADLGWKNALAIFAFLVKRGEDSLLQSQRVVWTKLGDVTTLCFLFAENCDFERYGDFSLASVYSD